MEVVKSNPNMAEINADKHEVTPDDLHQEGQRSPSASSLMLQ